MKKKIKMADSKDVFCLSVIARLVIDEKQSESSLADRMQSTLQLNN